MRIRNLFLSFLLLAFLSVATAADASPAIVQTCSNGSFGTSITCNTSSSVTAGDVIHAIAYGSNNTSSPAFSGTGSCNVTWHSLTSVATEGYASAYGSIASTGACGVTMTATNTSQIFINIIEMSGVNATIDGHATSTNGSNLSSYTTPTSTTSLSGDMIIASWIANKGNSPGTTTVNAPFTCASGLCGTTNANGGIAWDVQSASGPISATFNKTGTVFGSFLETTAYTATPTPSSPRRVLIGHGITR